MRLVRSVYRIESQRGTDARPSTARLVCTWLSAWQTGIFILCVKGPLYGTVRETGDEARDGGMSRSVECGLEPHPRPSRSESKNELSVAAVIKRTH